MARSGSPGPAIGERVYRRSAYRRWRRSANLEPQASQVPSLALPARVLVASGTYLVH